MSAAEIAVTHRFLRQTYEPSDFPGLVSFWDFEESSERFTARQGEAYVLQAQAGSMAVNQYPDAPLSGRALDIQEGQWLSIPRRACPGLDIHGGSGHLTLVAWLRRQPRLETPPDRCEFVAGQWNETERTRQYGLFLNIPVWGHRDTICGHLSQVGGPTPGYHNCIDGAMGATAIAHDQWHVIAMSYDGQAGYAWLDGTLDDRPQLNPYPLAGGLHDGGPDGSDFTVGASSHRGRIGSFFRGQLAGLAVYARALTAAEIYALSKL